MLKISYAGYLGLSPAIPSQLIFEVCTAAKKYEKFAKNSSFWGSKSFKVIYVDKTKSPCPVLVDIVSNLSVPICNRFHTRRANSSRK